MSSNKVDMNSVEDREAFTKALSNLTCLLAEDVVRNGEGVNHVVKVTINGAPSNSFARDVSIL